MEEKRKMLAKYVLRPILEILKTGRMKNARIHLCFKGVSQTLFNRFLTEGKIQIWPIWQFVKSPKMKNTGV